MARQNRTEQWSRRPTADDMPLTFLVNRAGPTGHSPQIVLSGDVEGGYVHFIRGRSVKCTELDTCPHCPHTERRWRGYLVVADARTHEVTLLELTAAAMKPIDLYFRKHRSLRGALLETKRIPPKTNGRLYAKIQESAREISTLPEVPSVRSILRKLWGLQKEEVTDKDLRRKLSQQDDNPDPQEA